MGFSTSVADDVFVRCRRHCCICDVFAGQKMELHHIKQVADGGTDSIDNCIPLCLNCHAEVKAYNPKHPKGRKYTENELREHRDKCYAKYENVNEPASVDEDSIRTNFFKSRNYNSMFSWGHSIQEKRCPVMSGTLILVAGYTGEYKSTYLHHIVNCNVLNSQQVVYCCLKDNPFEVGVNIILEPSLINYNKLKMNMMSEADWDYVDTQMNSNHSNNLVLLPYDRVCKPHDILDVIRNSNADIVFVDDFNGICMSDESRTEDFLYQLKSAVNMNNVTVICAYNLKRPDRFDMHPMLRDFTAEYFYRVFDVVQLLYQPENYDDYSGDNMNILEIITQKGTVKCPYTVRMAILKDCSRLVEYRSEGEDG